METRTTRKIRMTPNEAKELVQIASSCDFDIDIFYNRYIVDAKSILGVLGLDFNQILNISYSGYNQEFEDFLKVFSIAS